MLVCVWLVCMRRSVCAQMRVKGNVCRYYVHFNLQVYIYMKMHATHTTHSHTHMHTHTHTK